MKNKKKIRIILKIIIQTLIKMLIIIYIRIIIPIFLINHPHLKSQFNLVLSTFLFDDRSRLIYSFLLEFRYYLKSSSILIYFHLIRFQLSFSFHRSLVEHGKMEFHLFTNPSIPISLLCLYQLLHL
jgi:hypothetical protein